MKNIEIGIFTVIGGLTSMLLVYKDHSLTGLFTLGLVAITILENKK